jgi:hypothetical protein
MKRIVIVLLLGLVFVAFGVSGAYADDGGAVIIKDIACWWSSPIGFLTTMDSHTVVTPSGNVVLVCHFDIPEELVPDEVVKVKGLSCGIYTGNGGVFTDDTFALANQGGNAMLRCRYLPEDMP